MAFTEQIREAILRVHCATRALKIARDIQNTRRLLVADFPDTAEFMIDDVAEALVQRLQEAEADLAALIEAAGGSITDPANGHVLTMRANDRRDDPRPQFILTRLHGLGAASPAQQRQYAQRVRSWRASFAWCWHMRLWNSFPITATGQLSNNTGQMIRPYGRASFTAPI
jgi:hypothetical protein